MITYEYYEIVSLASDSKIPNSVFRVCKSKDGLWYERRVSSCKWVMDNELVKYFTGHADGAKKIPMNHLTTAECANLLGISRPRVRQLILNNQLPAIKLGRDWIIKEQDLEIFKAVPRKVGRPKSKTAS